MITNEACVEQTPSTFVHLTYRRLAEMLLICVMMSLIQKMRGSSIEAFRQDENRHHRQNEVSPVESIEVLEYVAAFVKVDRVISRIAVIFILVASFLASFMEILQVVQLQRAADDHLLTKIQPHRRANQVGYLRTGHRGHRLMAVDRPNFRPEEPAVRVWTQITFSAEYDQDIIPHTLKHYMDNGLKPEYMLITLHHTDPEAVDELASAVASVKEFGAHHIQTWHGNFTSQKNCDMRIQQRVDVGVSDCDWIIKLDADELLRVPGNDMPSFLQVLGSQRFDSVFGNWVDRVAEEGGIPNITATRPLAEQFPVGCRFSLTGNATTTKVVAFRGYLSEFRAGHYLRDTLETCRYPPQLLIDHYKWSWPVFTKLQRRIEHYRSIEGHHWWTESASFLEHIASNGGRIDVNRSDLSCNRQDDVNGDAAASQRPVLDSFYREKTNYDVCQRPLTQCPSRVLA
jgi:Glycosyl transferase family 2